MKNQFELLNLSVSFNLDINELTNQYLILQKQLHPDNFVSKSSKEQYLAASQSAKVNDAYRMLKDPISRAEAILSIADSEYIDGANSNRDTSFLIQQLELRERLDNIEHTYNNEQLTILEKDINELNIRELDELHNAIEQKNWLSCRLHIDRLKFIKKLSQEIDRVEDILFAS